MNKLSEALDNVYKFQFSSNDQKKILTNLIEKNFRQPNNELKWTDKPFPWTLYMPSISLEDLMTWGKND